MSSLIAQKFISPNINQW